MNNATSRQLKRAWKLQRIGNESLKTFARRVHATTWLGRKGSRL